MPRILSSIGGLLATVRGQVDVESLDIAHRFGSDVMDLQDAAEECRLGLSIQESHPWRAAPGTRGFLALAWAAFAYYTLASALVSEADGRAKQYAPRGIRDVIAGLLPIIRTAIIGATEGRANPSRRSSIKLPLDLPPGFFDTSLGSPAIRQLLRATLDLQTHAEALLAGLQPPSRDPNDCTFMARVHEVQAGAAARLRTIAPLGADNVPDEELRRAGGQLRAVLRAYCWLGQLAVGPDMCRAQPNDVWMLPRRGLSPLTGTESQVSRRTYVSLGAAGLAVIGVSALAILRSAPAGVRQTSRVNALPTSHPDPTESAPPGPTLLASDDFTDPSKGLFEAHGQGQATRFLNDYLSYPNVHYEFSYHNQALVATVRGPFPGDAASEFTSYGASAAAALKITTGFAAEVVAQAVQSPESVRYGLSYYLPNGYFFVFEVDPYASVYGFWSSAEGRHLANGRSFNLRPVVAMNRLRLEVRGAEARCLLNDTAVMWASHPQLMTRDGTIRLEFGMTSAPKDDLVMIEFRDFRLYSLA